MTQGNQQPPGQANGDGAPASPSQDIVAAIRAFSEKYEDSQKGRPEHDSETLKWTKRTGLGVGIYTLITLGIGAIGFCALLTAQDTERRQLRAYIIATKAEFERNDKGAIKLGDGANGLHPLLIDYELQNEGVTPGYAVETLVDVEFPAAEHVKFDYTVGIAAYMPKQRLFGPIVTRHFSDEERNQILSGDKPLLFAGQVTYRDIFGSKWPTNFCFLHTKWPTEPRFGFCPRWNDADRLQYAK
jgi:hypothetical protein